MLGEQRGVGRTARSREQAVPKAQVGKKEHAVLGQRVEGCQRGGNESGGGSTRLLLARGGCLGGSGVGGWMAKNALLVL